MSLRAFSDISPGLICWIGAIGELDKPYCHHLGGLDEDVILKECRSSDFEVAWRIGGRVCRLLVPKLECQEKKATKVAADADRQEPATNTKNHLQRILQ